jgi:DNA-binding NtrC family response regulator
MQFTSRIFPEQLLVCATHPDERLQLIHKLSAQGFSVMATGNANVASSLVQERPFKALIFSVPCLKLSMLSLLVLARRSQPQMPVMLVFAQPGINNVPASLIDVVLNQHDDTTFEQALENLWHQPPVLMTAS